MANRVELVEGTRNSALLTESNVTETELLSKTQNAVSFVTYTRIKRVDTGRTTFLSPNMPVRLYKDEER